MSVIKTKFKIGQKIFVIVERYTENPFYVVEGVIRYIHIDDKIKYSIGWGKLISEKDCFINEENALKEAKKRNKNLSKCIVTNKTVYFYPYGKFSNYSKLIRFDTVKEAQEYANKLNRRKQCLK